MGVALLRGENFRLYKTLQIEPHASLNLIVGDNATGKTSLLEALFVLARGRSFRAQNLVELCGSSGPRWHVFAEYWRQDGRHRAGIGWTREGLDLRLDEERGARVADVVRSLPLQLIDPSAHRLLDEGPAYRRSFVDWGVFHVEHRFLEVWRRYQRALKQRNRALKEQLGSKAVQAWNEELATTGIVITELRERHVAEVEPGFVKWASLLLGEVGVALEWQRGWAAEQDYRQVLEQNYEQHQRLGTTVQGPHRAELKILTEKLKAKGRISRGQQKMLIAAMVLAQSELLMTQGVSAPVLLLDDFASELAPEFQLRLAAALAAYRGQKFVSAFEVPAGFVQHESRMFHVEQGTIRAQDRLH